MEPPGTAASASERAETTDSEIAVAEKFQRIPDFDSYSYRFHIALDGNGVNDLEGMAGTCLFLYNPQSGGYAYKIRYYPGIAAGHAVAVNPGGTIGFLGNAGQHLLFYDAQTLEEIDRISTLRYAVPRSSLQGSTHIVWLTDRDFITAIGDFLYRFSIDSLDSGERLAPHGVKLPTP